MKNKLFLLFVLVGLSFGIAKACTAITQDNTTYIVRPDECITISGNFTNVTIQGQWKPIGDHQNLNYGETYNNNDVDIKITCQDAPYYNITKVLGNGQCYLNETIGMNICASNETLNLTQALEKLNYTELGSKINLQCPDISGVLGNYTKCQNTVKAQKTIIDKQTKELDNCTSTLSSLKDENKNLTNEISGMTVNPPQGNNNSSFQPDNNILLIGSVIAGIGAWYFIRKKGLLNKIQNNLAKGGE